MAEDRLTPSPNEERGALLDLTVAVGGHALYDAGKGIFHQVQDKLTDNSPSASDGVGTGQSDTSDSDTSSASSD